MDEEEAAICREEDDADAQQLNHHAEILRSSDLLVHPTFLTRDTDEQENIEDEHEQNQGEPMGNLFVEGEKVTRSQITRRCAIGDGLVVGILAWVENEEDEIVDGG